MGLQLSTFRKSGGELRGLPSGGPALLGFRSSLIRPGCGGLRVPSDPSTGFATARVARALGPRRRRRRRLAPGRQQRHRDRSPPEPAVGSVAAAAPRRWRLISTAKRRCQCTGPAREGPGPSTRMIYTGRMVSARQAHTLAERNCDPRVCSLSDRLSESRLGIARSGLSNGPRDSVWCVPTPWRKSESRRGGRRSARARRQKEAVAGLSARS